MAKPEVIATFGKCPVCELREELAEILGKPELKRGDGTRRFVDSLAGEVKLKGWMALSTNFWMYIFHGVVQDTKNPAMDAKIPIGSVLPGYNVCVDVCMDCGCIYAGKLERGEAKKSLPPAQSRGMPPSNILLGPFGNS